MTTNNNLPHLLNAALPDELAAQPPPPQASDEPAQDNLHPPPTTATEPDADTTDNDPIPQLDDTAPTARPSITSSSIKKLQRHDVRGWLQSVLAHAHILGIPQYLQPHRGAIPPRFMKYVATLSAAMTASIPSILQNQIFPDDDDMTLHLPSQIIAAVRRTLQTYTHADYLIFETEAINLHPSSFETIEGYFDAHFNMKAKMRDAAYPNIRIEQTYLRFLYQSLAQDFRLTMHIPAWSADHTIRNIHDLKVRVVTFLQMHRVTTMHHNHPMPSYATQKPLTPRPPKPTHAKPNVPKVFCKHHASLGRILPHSDEECRHRDHPKLRTPNTANHTNIGSAFGRYFPSNDSVYSFASQQAPSPMPYSSQTQAMPHMQYQPPHPPHFPPPPPSDHWSLPHDSADEASQPDATNGTSAILDTGAYPTHIKKPQRNFTKTNQISTTANGTPISLTHTGVHVLHTPHGDVRSAAVVAPSVRTNLISVHEINRKNKAATVFTADHAYILPRSSVNHILPHVTPSATWINSAYTLNPKHAHMLSFVTDSNPSASSPHPPDQSSQTHTTHTSPPAMHSAAKDISPYTLDTASPATQAPRRVPISVTNVMGTTHSSSTPDRHTSAAHGWHLALNHAPLPALRRIQRLHTYPSLNEIKLPHHLTCTACHDGKLSIQPHSAITAHHHPARQDLSSDIIGPIHPPSDQNHRYILTVLDNNSKFMLIALLHSRDQTSTHLPKLIQDMQHLRPNIPIHLRTDNGREFTSRHLRNILHRMGIQHSTTVAHTPQMNSQAERINRTLFNCIRCALAHSHMPLSMWHFAAIDACFKYNHIPHSAHDKTPISCMQSTWSKPPYFLPFGVQGAIPNRQAHKSKLHSRAVPAQYLYPIFHNMICIRLLPSQRTTTARLCDFHPVQAKFNPVSTHIQAFHTSIPIPQPPRHFRQALTYPDKALWAAAHDNELRQLEQQHAIEWIHDTTFQPPTRAIPLTMSYRYKLDDKGRIAQRKARCSVRGDQFRPHQHYDPDRTAAYAADKTSIRVLIAIAAAKRQPLRAFDISSAYTAEQYTHDRPVYVTQHPLFNGTMMHPNAKYGKLKLNLYGTPSAAATYFNGLRQHLAQHGFVATSSDPCLFIHRSKAILVCSTTDDFLVTAPTLEHISHFARTLRSKYHIKELGRPKQHIGWLLTYANHTIHISQPHLIQKALDKHAMTEANPRSSPLPSKPDFDDEALSPKLDTENAELYRSTIGDLRYLADSTRFDVAFATSRLARHSKAPTTKHMMLLKHVLRYLKRTKTHGILYSDIPAPPLESYADADFAQSTNRKSTSGAIHVSFGAPVAWLSKRQSTVALSTCEAEYLAASYAVQETLWLRHLIAELTNPDKPPQDVPILPPTAVRVDNLAAIKVATHQARTKLRKHIQIRRHHMHDNIRRNHITIQHIEGRLNPADHLTKPTCPPIPFIQPPQTSNIGKPGSDTYNHKSRFPTSQVPRTTTITRVETPMHSNKEYINTSTSTT